MACGLYRLAGTSATFFMLFVPAVLAGLPVTIFAKSPRMKFLAITTITGVKVLIADYS